MGTPDELNFFTSHTLKRFGDKPIALCADHSGFKLKEIAKTVLLSNNLQFIDFGTFVNKDCDYNDYVSQVVEFINKGSVDFGCAFCRTGQGINIAANKNNCANFFSIPQKYVTEKELDKMVKVWKNTTFDGGRHMIRVQKVEQNECK